MSHLDLFGLVSFVQSDFEYLLTPLRQSLESLVLPDNADFPTVELSLLVNLRKLATSRPTQTMIDRLAPAVDHLVILPALVRQGRAFDLGVIRTQLGRFKRLDVHATLDGADLAVLRHLCSTHNVILDYQPGADHTVLAGGLPQPLWLKARTDAHAENRRRRQQGWSHESVARLARAAFAHIKDNADAARPGADLDGDRLSPGEINWFLSVLEAGEGEGWRAPLPPPVGNAGGVGRGRWGTNAEWRGFYEDIRIGFVPSGGRGPALIDEGAFKGLLLWWLETGKLAAWKVSTTFRSSTSRTGRLMLLICCLQSVDELIDLHELDFMVDEDGVEFDPIGFPTPPDGDGVAEGLSEEDE